MEQILVQAIRGKGVENRTLAFYLHDMDQRLEHQQLGFPTTVKFAEVRWSSSAPPRRRLPMARVRHT